MEELKLRIRKTGLKMKDFAKSIGVRYYTLSNYLNVFSPMPDHVKKKIEEELDKNNYS